MDVMPTLPDVLGFSNRWYGEAFSEASWVRIPEGLTIRLVLPPHFLAIKIEAFRGRGRGDFLASHDLEDIVAVLDGRRQIVEEVARANAPLRRFLGEAFGSFLQHPRFVEAVSGHLPPDPSSQARATIVLERIRELVRQGR